MIELTWLDRFPDRKLEEGLRILDRMCWHINVVEYEQGWSVYSGEVVVFRTDSRESLDAFLYGLGLTYVSMDQAIVESLIVEIKKYVE